MNIQVSDLCKKYKEQCVLQNINLDLKDVSSVGIIGSSGCGKSTLLRHLSGIENPDSGEITINHVSPLLEKKKFQEKIGMIFQQHNLFPHLSLEKNITLILEKIKKLDKETATDKALDILSQLYLLEHKDKLPSEVSGGQAQRTSIARALATDPELIFMDEPTAALDPQLTYEVLQSVEKLKVKGINFVFVTHEIKFLQRFADYFIFIHQGEVVEQGEVAQLENPKTTLLHEFLKPHFM